MKKCLLCIMFFCAFTMNAKTIYVITKPDGTKVFSDTPMANSKVLNLNAYPVNVMPRVAATPPPPNNFRRQARPAIDYKLKLTQPQPEQNIRANSGEITISGKLEPQGAGIFKLEMNGKIVEEQNNPYFQLKNVDRGAHKIQIHFTDKSGKILASSPEQTFYLHRTSVLNRAN